MMNGLSRVILAQADADPTDFLRRLAKAMREGRGSGLLFIGVVAVLVAAFLLLRWLGARSGATGKRARDNPLAVFRGLIHCHRLDPAEVRVLEGVATTFSLVDPGVLFARPTVFDRYLEQYLRQIEDDDLRHRAHAEVVRLRDRLFGQIDVGAETAAFGEADHQPLLE